MAAILGIEKLFRAGWACYNKTRTNYDRLLVLAINVLSPCEADERYGHNN